MHDFPPVVASTDTPESRSPARFLGWLMRAQGDLVVVMTLLLVAWQLPNVFSPWILGRAIDAGIVSRDPWATIGWVGLLIPHAARMIFGNDNRRVVPASMGLGAIFMLIIDTAARSAIASEIPASILTAVIGAPFFIILLRRTGGIRA